MQPRLRDRGFAFLDASRIFENVDATLYVDSCHLNPDGLERLAETVAPALFATLPDGVPQAGQR